MSIPFIIFLVASLLYLVGLLWLVVVGFSRSTFWGVMVLLFSPITAIIFAMINWFSAKWAFITYLISTIVLIGSFGYIINNIGTQNLAEISRRLQTGELTKNELAPTLEKALSMNGAYIFQETAEKTDENTLDTANTSVTGSEMPISDTATADVSETPSKSGVEMDQTVNADTAATGDNAQVQMAENKQNDTPSKTAGSKDDKKTDQDEPVRFEPVDEKIPSTTYPEPGKVKPDPLVAPKKKQESDFVIVSYDNVRKYKGRYFVIYTTKKTYLKGLLVKADANNLYLDRKLFGGSFSYPVSKKKIKTIYMLKKEFVAEREQNRLPGE